MSKEVYKPWPYQQYATEKIVNVEKYGLLLDMGLGKTVSTLTAIDKLINEAFDVSKVLIIAPKRVTTDTWPDEIEKWEHLKNLRYSVITSDEKKRVQALRKDTDIYLINRENVAWLIGHLQGAWPFDMLVVDESSSFKDHQSQRFKALRIATPRTKRVVILTGTPTPNGLIDLWPQIYLLDTGERLGKTVSEYRNRFFRPDKTNGHVVYSYKINDGAETAIFERISDIVTSMKAEDYLKLPERVDNIVNVHMTDEAMKAYKEFERDQVHLLIEEAQREAIRRGEIELEDLNPDSFITAANAAVLAGKLLQFANGAVYDAERRIHETHTAKLEALEDIVEGLNGDPVLVFYAYQHDKERIIQHFKRLKPRNLDGSAEVRDWNSGKIKMLLAHPASAGHGLNLQRGGANMVWFGLNWSLELYQQANARLHRQGQTRPVYIHHLVCPGTMDIEVLNALRGKEGRQERLLQAVKARVNEYFNEKISVI